MTQAAIPSSTVEGTVARVRFANPKTRWAVVSVVTADRRTHTVVGALGDPRLGDKLHAVGHVVTDPKWGPQFRATAAACGRTLEDARAGLADRHATVRRLQDLGATPAMAARIFNLYGARTWAMLEADPYRLVQDLEGSVSFAAADRIASALGLAPDDPRRVAAGLARSLRAASEHGHVCVPRDELTSETSTLLGVSPDAVTQQLPQSAANGQLVVEPTANGTEVVYLPPLQRAEAGLAAALTELARGRLAGSSEDGSRIIAAVEQKQGFALAPAQRAAVLQAASDKVLVITGGPGTGKTTIVRTILALLQAQGKDILLAAPTGRAAKRMTESCGMPASTIHRLLEFKPDSLTFGRNASAPLGADVVVIDEASMLDTALAHSLLDAIPRGAQVILVGDVDQLPSVGPGSVLADLINSGVLPVARLGQVFRQGAQSPIVTNAHRINTGERPSADPKSASEFMVLEHAGTSDIVSAVKTLLTDTLPKLGYHPLDDVQILTPMHHGVLGTDNLNAELQALLNPNGAALNRGDGVLRVGDKVMQLKNNYDLDVFNGDVGRVEEIGEGGRELLVRYDGRTVRYSTHELDQLVLAYACTIHKSQGSEYPCVIVPVHPDQRIMLQKNLLYTAVTRGKKTVALVGASEAIDMAVQNSRAASRHTRLRERLQSAAPVQGAGGASGPVAVGAGASGSNHKS